MGSKVSVKINPEFERKFKELSKPRNVSLNELMPPTFMRANTKFQNIQEMFDKSELAAVGEEEIKGVLESEAWSVFVRTNTKFADWTEMLKAAGVEELRNHFRKGGLA